MIESINGICITSTDEAEVTYLIFAALVAISAFAVHKGKVIRFEVGLDELGALTMNACGEIAECREFGQATTMHADRERTFGSALEPLRGRLQTRPPCPVDEGACGKGRAAAVLR